MGPVPFPRGTIIDQVRACGSRTPDPCSFRVLGGEFSIASFWSIPMPHVPFPDLQRTHLILLLYPPSQSYPDVLVEFVEGSGRVDGSVITGPSSYQSIDGF